MARAFDQPVASTSAQLDPPIPSASNPPSTRGLVISKLTQLGKSAHMPKPKPNEDVEKKLRCEVLRLKAKKLKLEIAFLEKKADAASETGQSAMESTIVYVEGETYGQSSTYAEP